MSPSTNPTFGSFPPWMCPIPFGASFKNSPARTKSAGVMSRYGTRGGATGGTAGFTAAAGGATGATVSAGPEADADSCPSAISLAPGGTITTWMPG